MKEHAKETKPDRRLDAIVGAGCVTLLAALRLEQATGSPAYPIAAFCITAIAVIMHHRAAK